MTYLSDLTPKTRFYTVKVRIVAKNRAIQPLGNSRYERLIIKDDKGATMDATIYGEDIDIYNDIIQKNGEYEISNTYISRVNTNLPGHCADYQMTISGRTVVRRLDPEASSSIVGVQYRQLISIPRNPYTVAEYGSIRTITGSGGYPVNVCQVTLTDDSTPDAIVVSMWSDLATNEVAQLAAEVDSNPLVSFTDLHASKFQGAFSLYTTSALLTSMWSDLATNEVAQLAAEVDSNPLVSFTDLHASKFQGFSLATSRSTMIGLHPTRERANALRTWKATHASVIKDRMLAAAETCIVNTTPLASTIKEMISMTANTVVYDRRIRLSVFVPGFKPENIKLFYGCKLCGKRSSHEKTGSFECEFCGQLSATEPRVCFNFNGTDGSGTKLFSTYTNLAEKLLQVGTRELMEMTTEDKESFYYKISLKFRTIPTCLELSPTAPATREIQTIKWTAKDVVSE